MENASKALIMAASVLLGLMIISIGVVLYNSFSDFSKTTEAKMDEKKIAEFNNNFLKYYGTVNVYNKEKKEYEVQTIKVTIHDIITVANLAKKNNEEYEISDLSRCSENTQYIQVCLIGNNNNLEKNTDEKNNKLLKENSLKNENKETKYYKCTECRISEITKKVIYIEFKEY